MLESRKSDMLDFVYMKNTGLCVVIPVYNEEIDLPVNIPKLLSFLEKKMSSHEWEIVIADNASTDKTPEIAQEFAKDKRIKYLRLEKKGRGRALRKAWNTSGKRILSYMDIDLSSDLSCFLKLVKSIENGADIAIGSRLAKGAKVVGRTPVREIMSRGYSLLFRSLFRTKFKDAQCGFKAIKKNVWDKLEPVIEDKYWFFDTELLIISQKAGFIISEVPIVWRDDPDSTVKVAKTAWGDVKGLYRLFVEMPWKKLKKK
ncbi:MAG: glycosyltransferase family 2 protein [bacterium]|nr:glycosyltransferase family 2 protein [bacterium]